MDTAFSVNNRNWAPGAVAIPDGSSPVLLHPFLSLNPGDPLIDLGTLSGTYGAAFGLKTMDAPEPKYRLRETILERNAY